MTTVDATPERAAKACTNCEQVKPLDEFAPNKRRRDGRQSWCRECRKMWIRHRRAVDTGMVERGVRQRRAHTRAAARLREAHPEEFDRYYAEEKARMVAEFKRYHEAAGHTVDGQTYEALRADREIGELR